MAQFIIAVAYGKDTIAAELYHGRTNAEMFSSFVCEHFANIFKKNANPVGELSCRMVTLHLLVWKARFTCGDMPVL